MSPPDAADGPELLAERSVLGIFIHPITLLTGFFGVGIVLAAFVYLLSSHQFTRENARNALNWHLSVFLLALVDDLGIVASGAAGNRVCDRRRCAAVSQRGGGPADDRVQHRGDV